MKEKFSILKTLPSLGLRESEVSKHPDMGSIESISEWRLGIPVFVPGLQVNVRFAE
jgi:hypothetical protein